MHKAKGVGMRLSELISLFEQHIEEHGDYEVKSAEHEGDYVPYRAEWFSFKGEGLPGSTEGIYVI